MMIKTVEVKELQVTANTHNITGVRAWLLKHIETDFDVVLTIEEATGNAKLLNGLGIHRGSFAFAHTKKEVFAQRMHAMSEIAAISRDIISSYEIDTSRKVQFVDENYKLKNLNYVDYRLRSDKDTLNLGAFFGLDGAKQDYTDITNIGVSNSTLTTTLSAVEEEPAVGTDILRIENVSQLPDSEDFIFFPVINPNVGASWYAGDGVVSLSRRGVSVSGGVLHHAAGRVAKEFLARIIISNYPAGIRVTDESQPELVKYIRDEDDCVFYFAHKDADDKYLFFKVWFDQLSDNVHAYIMSAADIRYDASYILECAKFAGTMTDTYEKEYPLKDWYATKISEHIVDVLVGGGLINSPESESELEDLAVDIEDHLKYTTYCKSPRQGSDKHSCLLYYKLSLDVFNCYDLDGISAEERDNLTRGYWRIKILEDNNKICTEIEISKVGSVEVYKARVSSRMVDMMNPFIEYPRDYLKLLEEISRQEGTQTFGGIEEDE